MGFNWGALTGKSQAKTLKKSNAQAQGYLGAGLGQATGSLNTAYDAADTLINPYVQGGTKGYEAYNDAIGVNGLEGYGRAKTMFDADPFLAGQDADVSQRIKNALSVYNAGGDRNSKLAILGTGRIGAEDYARRVRDFRDRLAGAGSGGFNAAQVAGGYKMGRGNALADLNYGYGQQMAGNAINYGNARAQAQTNSAGQIVNGLSGLFGTALNAFTPGVTGVSPAQNFFSTMRR